MARPTSKHCHICATMTSPVSSSTDTSAAQAE
jgi:hypothetical protein